MNISIGPLGINLIILCIWVLGLALRLYSARISGSNEMNLRKNGAVEYGKRNSTVLGALHFAIYLFSLVEALLRKTPFEKTSILPLILYAFGMVMLFYVIKQLGEIWTVKLMIARNHTLNKSPIFKYIRHPNYFLAMIPELLGLMLLCKSWFTLLILFPAYLISLIVRIAQEEAAMKTKFPNY